MKVDLQPAPGRDAYNRERIALWDRVARRREAGFGWSTAYHERLASVYRFMVPPGGRILELGSGTGDLLAALKPAVGVGVDFSPPMLELARRRHPELRFIEADAHALGELAETFDTIILSDLVDDVWDVQGTFHSLKPLCKPRTRVILNFYNKLWGPLLTFVRRLGLAPPMLQQNWLTVHDVANMLELEGFEVVTHRVEILLPLRIPLLAALANRWLVRIWPFSLFGLTHVLCARPRAIAPAEAPLVSVIVAARNEAGNIANIFARTPELGAGTELVFVEGGSSDDTYDVIERTIREHPERRCKLLRQSGMGKGDAVRAGFAEAAGDVLMILDADLTVPPEELPRFLDALVSGRAEYVNGVRLVYPMEARAMRFFNLVGNKFFSAAFSWLLGRPIRDTLCGTKVLWKADYERIAANRAYFGDFDPFGDFDLIFGAAKLNLKMLDVPVRYRERVYGDTNIQRWRHGVLLLRMVLFAARRIKFV